MLNFFSGGISPNDKANLTNHLAILIEAGVSLPEAIASLSEEMRSKHLRTILVNSKLAIEAGQSLSQSWIAYPELADAAFLSLVKAGETSGNLAKILRSLGKKFKADIELKNQVIGALMYPTIVMLALVGMGVAMMIFVVPKLTDTFTKMDLALPIQTRILIFLSKMLTANYFLTIGIILLLAGGVFFLVSARGTAGLRSFIIKHIPFFNKISRNFDFVRLMTIMEILIAAGIPIIKILEIAGEAIGDKQLKTALSQASRDVVQGINLSRSFANHRRLFPSTIITILKVGEESGNLDKVIGELREFYDSELKNQLRIFSSMIEPILTLFIGLIIGVAVLSLISPIYQIVGNVSTGG